MKLISAISESGIIGLKHSNTLPWSIPEDLAHFKRLTTGQTVVMGYRTFESMWFKPLPKRTNVVLGGFGCGIDNVVGVSSIQEILDIYNESWVIGGASVYEQLINYCDELHLTIVPDKFLTPADNYVKFPWINPLKFRIRSAEPLRGKEELIYCIMEKV